jgi:nucleotide-binding universal stress UspA family protein
MPGRGDSLKGATLATSTSTSTSTPTPATRHLSRFDSLIVPHDLSGLADRAVPIVGGLARRGGLSVRLVTTASPGLDLTQDRTDLAAHARRIHGCPVTPVVLESNEPADELAEFARRHPGALLCVGTHGRTALGELVLGSMTDDLLHHHLGPVLVVGPRVDHDVALSDNLLVGVDEYALESSLFDVANAWQLTFGGTIELFEAVVRTRPTAKLEPTPELREAQSLAPTALTTIVESHDPVSAILDAASASDSVIAVASHLRSGVERAVLGSVAWEVVRWSPTPVLVVPGERTS